MTSLDPPTMGPFLSIMQQRQGEEYYTEKMYHLTGQVYCVSPVRARQLSE